MNTLLQLNTSLFSTSGQSSRLAEQFVARWRAAHPAGRVIVRDLARNPVPHLTAERFQAFLAKPGERTPAQQAIVDESDPHIVAALARAAGMAISAWALAEWTAAPEGPESLRELVTLLERRSQKAIATLEAAALAANVARFDVSG